MPLNIQKLGIVVATSVLMACATASAIPQVKAAEKSTPGVRYKELASAPGLERIQRIAIAPAIVVLVFDSSGRLPDPYHYALRRAVANEIGPLVRELLSERTLTVLYEETAALIEESGQDTISLIRTGRGTDETVRDSHKNVCHLEMKRSELRIDPLSFTVFRFVPDALKDLSAGFTGLAAVKRGATAQWNSGIVTTLAKKLHVDAVLVLRVEDMDHSKAIAIFKEIRGLWTSVHATLLSAEDGSVIWDAALQGYSETTLHSRDPWAVGERWDQTELTQALEGIARLAPVMVDHLAAHGH